ncbi:MAG: hydantoinase/oxoprolinase family protein [Gammaproteobacteria bacterium]
MKYRISVDTGGTFTDVVVTDEGGKFTVGKALTDKKRAFSSIAAGLEVACEELKISVAELLASTSVFIYGTTRATNGIVERKIARTAFLSTEGFPDTLLLKEGGKAETHNLRMEYPDPYIPRSLTFEIPERISAEGTIEHSLDEQAVRRLLTEFKTKKIEAIAVCLLWSIANPVHEKRIGELIEEFLPGVPYTLSSEINPILREYRRASSTAIDASLKPLMQEYLLTLEKDLRNAGYENDILVSTSFGGVMHLSDVVLKPIFLVKSGPAMAPIAGLAYVAAEELAEDVIVCDAGGTTFDVSLVRDGQVEFTRDTWLGPQWTGDNLGMASVAVHSIGAGGGSIAWVDTGGLLQVGPRSAGSEPGPACYGLGGLEPTVTDAAVALGYIDPKHFLGGRMHLDESAARKAIKPLAVVLNESIEHTAFAIIAVANENMIQAIKELTVNEGINPADSTLVAGGGAGGLGIAPIAAELGCRNVLIPRTAGALSASGMQFSDIITETGASKITVTDAFDFDGVNAALSTINKQLDQFASNLMSRGISEIKKRYFVEARYRFQVWELEVEIETGVFNGPEDVDALVQAFHNMHERVFAITDIGQAVECLNWRGRLIADVKAPSLEPPRSDTENRATADRIRKAYFGKEPIDTSIYLGSDLNIGVSIDGPAIIEEPTSTLVVNPGANVKVSSGGRYILTPSEHGLV